MGIVGATVEERIQCLQDEKIHQLIGVPEDELLTIANRLTGSVISSLGEAAADEEISDSVVGRDKQSDQVLRKWAKILVQDRDRKIVFELKEKYRFCCLVCRSPLMLGNGASYCEAAHIVPLGAPHHGPDMLDNLIPLCPNHHLQFDSGGQSVFE